jgi:hypothetical protein
MYVTNLYYIIDIPHNGWSVEGMCKVFKISYLNMM